MRGFTGNQIDWEKQLSWWLEHYCKSINYMFNQGGCPTYGHDGGRVLLSMWATSVNICLPTSIFLSVLDQWALSSTDKHWKFSQVLFVISKWVRWMFQHMSSIKAASCSMLLTTTHERIRIGHRNWDSRTILWLPKSGAINSTTTSSKTGRLWERQAAYASS